MRKDERHTKGANPPLHYLPWLHSPLLFLVNLALVWCGDYLERAENRGAKIAPLGKEKYQKELWYWKVRPSLAPKIIMIRRPHPFCLERLLGRFIFTKQLNPISSVFFPFLLFLTVKLGSIPAISEKERMTLLEQADDRSAPARSSSFTKQKHDLDKLRKVRKNIHIFLDKLIVISRFVFISVFVSFSWSCFLLVSLAPRFLHFISRFSIFLILASRCCPANNGMKNPKRETRLDRKWREQNEKKREYTIMTKHRYRMWLFRGGVRDIEVQLQQEWRRVLGRLLLLFRMRKSPKRVSSPSQNIIISANLVVYVIWANNSEFIIGQIIPKCSFCSSNFRNIMKSPNAFVYLSKYNYIISEPLLAV